MAHTPDDHSELTDELPDGPDNDALTDDEARSPDGVEADTDTIAGMKQGDGDPIGHE